MNYQWQSKGVNLDLSPMAQPNANNNAFKEHLEKAGQAYNAGEFGQAEAICKAILNQDSECMEALHALAILEDRKQNYFYAQKLIEKSISKSPNNPFLFNSLGVVLDHAGRLGDAISSFRKAVSINQEYTQAINNLAMALQKAGKVNEAKALFDKVIEANPDNADVYNNIGNNCYLTGELDLAIEYFKKAIEINPDMAFAWNNLGNCYRAKGMFKETVECCEKAIDIKPGYAEAHRHLSLLHKYSNREGHIEEVEAILKKDGLSEKDLMHLYFAAARLHDAAGNYDPAFQHYQAGNQLRGKEFGYKRQMHTHYVDRLIKIFSRPLYKRSSYLSGADDNFVFIMGMPRSGTTLVEQIISSHPKVYGAGEIEYFNYLEQEIQAKLKSKQPYPECVLELSSSNLYHIAEEYKKELDYDREQHVRVTDKMPRNFLSLGLILLLFPNSRVIHCKRNPIDTCLSNYFQFFSGGNAHAYDLEDLAAYYKDYQRLIEHWKETFPGKIFDIQYESIIDDQEKYSRQLIEHIGLEWDDACLSFHKNKKSIKTASSMQARQPIYKDSVARWKHYSKYLQPLIDAFGEEAADMDAA